MTHTRTLRRTAALLATSLIAASGVALTSGAASAAVCVTAGHAYFIKPISGPNYMSGFEGDQRYGVPTVTALRGDGFELGGNGIKPGTRITFTAVSGMFGASNSLVTSTAASNCVVDQTRNRAAIGNLPNGTYTLFASYTGGNSGRFVNNEPVVKIKVIG
jgi:hypothetical protein